jgi:hypothetical protein
MGSGSGGYFPGSLVARLRARRQMLEATEADLRERGIAVPPVRMSRGRFIAIAVASLMMLGLLTGLIAWLIR